MQQSTNLFRRVVMVDLRFPSASEFLSTKGTAILLLLLTCPDSERSFAVDPPKTILLLFLFMFRVVLSPASYVVYNPLPILTCPSSVDFEPTFSIASIVFSLFPLSFLLGSAIRHFSASF